MTGRSNTAEPSPFKKALVVGGSGQLGAGLAAVLGSRGVRVRSTHCSHPLSDSLRLDIRDRETIAGCFAQTEPDIVFLAHNTPGGVDFCEDHPDQARLLLVQGIQDILAAALPYRAKIVYFSSDYVFDGKSGPYDEDAAPGPISVYGRAKLEAERLVEAYAHAHLTIRTTAVFSWTPGTKNFAMQLWESLRAGKTFRVPHDQWCNPTLAGDLAQASVDLAWAGHGGLFNVVGRDWLPRAELAQALARALSLDASLIQPVATKALCQKALRPLKGGLKTDKLAKTLGAPPPSLADALSRLARQARDSHA